LVESDIVGKFPKILADSLKFIIVSFFLIDWMTHSQTINDAHVSLDYSEYFDVGEPRYVCKDCNALMWYEERANKNRRTSTPEFSMCCMQGRIEIAPFARLPQSLHELYFKDDRKCKYFLDNIRSFNSMFAFTSIGAKIDKTKNNGRAPPVFTMNGENYHQIGSLLPKPGDQPKFAQLYIYDTDNETHNRMASLR
jgi:hypothetical protein